MKKYYKFSNKGLLEMEALFNIGLSSKDANDSSTIGQFGSGLKYAIACFVREGIEVIIHTNYSNIVVDTVDKTFRDKEYKLIRFNGKESAYGPNLGSKDWVVGMAIREVLSNSLDEGTSRETNFFEEVELGKPGNGTDIYIEVTDKTKGVADNQDLYFSLLRTDVIEEHKYIKVYPSINGKGVVYKNGIACYSRDKALFCYDLPDISLNESRLANYWDVRFEFSCVCNVLSKDIAKQIVLASKDLMEYEFNLKGKFKKLDFKSEEFVEEVTNLETKEEKTELVSRVAKVVQDPDTIIDVAFKDEPKEEVSISDTAQYNLDLLKELMDCSVVQEVTSTHRDLKGDLTFTEKDLLSSDRICDVLSVMRDTEFRKFGEKLISKYFKTYENEKEENKQKSEECDELPF